MPSSSPVPVPHNHEKPINKFKSEDFFVDDTKMTGLDNISKILMLITQDVNVLHMELSIVNNFGNERIEDVVNDRTAIIRAFFGKHIGIKGY